MSFDRRNTDRSQAEPGAAGMTAAPGKRTQVDLLHAADEAAGAAPDRQEDGLATGRGAFAGASEPGGAPAAARPGTRPDREAGEDDDAEATPGVMEEGELVCEASGSSEEGSEASSDESFEEAPSVSEEHDAGDEHGAHDARSANDAPRASGPQSATPSASGPQSATPSASGPSTSAPESASASQDASSQGASASQDASGQGAGASQGASSQRGARGAAAQGAAATGDGRKQGGSGDGKATAKASGIDPPVRGTPAIRSSTVKSAPNGAADTRTRVAVGEVVRLVGSLDGAWSANHGKLHGSHGMHTTWTAPASPGTTTIRFSGGGRSTTKKFTVIAPNHLSMKRASVDSWPAGVQGAGMITNVTIGPRSVSFGNVEWLEVPGGPSHIFGYFTKYKGLQHHPNPNWLGWNDANTGLTDHASLFRWPKPWSPGGFQWNIPNKYRVAGVGGAGHVFTTTHQIFRMTNKKGTTTITKGGASVTRTP